MKNIDIKINEYCPDEGLKINWEPDFNIQITNLGNKIYLKANSAGLKSIAKIFLQLSQNEVPVHTHIHLDEGNSLEEGSYEFIIEKDEF